MQTLAWLVLILPLAGSLVSALGFRALVRVSPRLPGVVGTVAIAGAFACSIGLLVKLQDLPADGRQVVFSAWDYVVTGGVDARLSILVDPLSVFMALVVTGVSMLIHLYSTTYLLSDRGYARFFSYLNFFVFSMLVLVLAGNFVILVAGWAFVGAASYLLISFWYRRTTATSAGIKAFVINVVGDVGIVLGTYFIFRHSHTLDFLGTFSQADKLPQGSLTAGLILLLVGAFAKSAQIPLHTWLPDAMEGPTPVSALIHAATMVTAGVYLIARMWPLFEQAPGAADVGSAIGLVTLLVAGTIGLVVTDLKRVIAYSTMSQIGYMIMAVSSGVYVGGLFHLMTHAFFKALLFMAAGSIIGAMAGEQSLDRMGGFRRAMPFTFLCFVVGGLCLAGIPPFSGFFSKDEILSFLGDRGGWYWALYAGGYVGALLTAVYTWRMIFRAFFGEPVPEAAELERGHLHHAEVHVNPANGEVEDTDVGFPGPDHHIAERSLPMKVAMGLLAIAATVGGVLQIPFGATDAVDRFLAPTFAGSRMFEGVHPSDGLTLAGMVLGAAIGLLGIAIAYHVWVRRPGTSAAIQARFAGLHRLFVNKWYFDEAIDALLVRPAAWLGRFFAQTFERLVVDGTLVGGTTGVISAASATVRRLQSGFVRAYAALLLVGLVAVSLYFLLQT
ncbi:MAG TPA: NADH-quinone oxidoreductase subunit L [Solirubrobacteraceae bacterium]|jgi:NADH-quinone oxidoreductase subunit L|nr:NADH-quinone oxidoreductase subunit L [Solirubrobacteraceae bacterium]